MFEKVVFPMENNNKTQAELYREERKERLAKAAAKNAKRSPKSIKASKTAKKVISIVLAVVIAFGAVAGVLNFFDVPQKAVKISIDGIKSKISLAEINFSQKRIIRRNVMFCLQINILSPNMKRGIVIPEYKRINFRMWW